MNRLLLGVAAALACAAAHSQTTTWTFTYTGFQSEDSQVFRPDATFKGAFSGSDLDADGTIERSELSSFVLFDGPETLNVLECPLAFPIQYSCEINRFSFTGQDGLDFSVEHSGGDLHTGHTKSIRGETATEWVWGISSGRSGEASRYHTFLWTPQTTLTIVSSVPEPAQAGMLALGLGLAALAGLRRLRPGAKVPLAG